MKKRLAALFLTCLIFVFTACSSIKPVPTATSLAASTDSSAAAEKLSEPVTRADYPAAYLPGIDAVGVIPAKGYHVGIVISQSSPYAANIEAFTELAKAYEAAFGMTVSVEQPDEAAQDDCITQMIGSGIEFLIFAPGSNESAADAICAQSGVPYLTLGQRLKNTLGEGGYVCTIEPDDFLCGILTGRNIADAMKSQYGEPLGNIAEITGVVSDKASILRSGGLRHALSVYSKLNVVCSVAGNGDKDTIYKSAENIFKACREGELDGIVVPDDSAAVTVLQAALDYDRNDVIGRIWSAGATVDGLTAVYYGQIAQTVETSSQTGMAAMEYAVRYLNGGTDIPAVITTLTRVFSAETQEKKDALKNIIAALKENDASACLESVGDYTLFQPETNMSNYPQRYDLYADVAAYLAAFEPYTTEKPIYRKDEKIQDEA